MTPVVIPTRVVIASGRLANAGAAAEACRVAGIPFYVACALLEKESGGRNVYGNDAGGALSGFPGDVNEHNYAVFEWLVVSQKHRSNGVGPCQITYPGYFPQMREQGLRPWLPTDNMVFGFRILAANHKATGSWEAAGARYNGGPNPSAAALAYGRDFIVKVREWKARLGIK